MTSRLRTFWAVRRCCWPSHLVLRMWPRRRPSPFPAAVIYDQPPGGHLDIQHHLQHRRGGGPTPPSCTTPMFSTVGSTLTFSLTCTQGTNPITSVTLHGVACAAVRCTNCTTYTIPAFGSDGHDHLHSHGFGRPLQVRRHGVTYVVGRRRRRRVDLTLAPRWDLPALGLTRVPDGRRTSISYMVLSARRRRGQFGNNVALVVGSPRRLGRERPDDSQPPAIRRRRIQPPGDDRDAPCLIATSTLRRRDRRQAVISQTPRFTSGRGRGPAQTPESWLHRYCVGTCSSRRTRPTTSRWSTRAAPGPAVLQYGDCDMRWNFNN